MCCLSKPFSGILTHKLKYCFPIDVHTKRSLESFEWGDACTRKLAIPYNLCILRKNGRKFWETSAVYTSVLFGKTLQPYWLRLSKCVPASLGGAGVGGGWGVGCWSGWVDLGITRSPVSPRREDVRRFLFDDTTQLNANPMGSHL